MFCLCTTRGYGGVAILFQRELHNRIEILRTDPKSSFYVGEVSTSKGKAVFFATCYFPPKGSHYNLAGEARLVDEGVPHGPSPYEPLSDDIIQYSSQGEVFLVGDFNARTQSR